MSDKMIDSMCEAADWAFGWLWKTLTEEWKKETYCPYYWD